jgi:hypothetical protein
VRVTLEASLSPAGVFCTSDWKGCWSRRLTAVLTERDGHAHSWPQEFLAFPLLMPS